MKKIAALFLCLIFIGISAFPVFGFEFYYEESEKIEITKGVTYESKKFVTDAGLLDVYILKIPITDEYISVSPLHSKTDYGLKETTSKITNDNYALAGINGDFFGMNGSYSTTLGLEVANGKVITQTSGQNAENRDSATFFIGKDNALYVTFFTCKVDFYNNGAENLEVYAINRVHDVTYPAVINREAMPNTESIDKRFPDTYKIVCDTENIIYISQKGETVEIPEDGYVIIINEHTYHNKKNTLAVGQTAKLVIENSVDLSQIKSAISGAGKVVENGYITDNGSVSSGRHPRTTVGITQDGKTVIFAAVDGRTHSKGATHQEMGQIMLNLGAFQAMHLDGGGSTTMAVKKPGDDWAGVVNLPSDGGQRKVMNVLGVVERAPVSEVTKIVISPSSSSILATGNASLTVYGLDEYNHKIAIDPSLIAFNVESGGGSVFDGDFYPYAKGTAVISADFNGIKAACQIKVNDLAQINPSTKSLYIKQGEKAELSFSGLTTAGTSVSIDEETMFFQVVPEDLGVMEGNVYNSLKSGQGYIKASSGNVSVYIPIYSSLTEKSINPINSDIKVSYTAYPESVKGSAAFSNEQTSDKNGSVKLTYEMGKSDQTQAAYALFENMTLQGEPKEVKLSCFGNNSGLWLRGKIVDKDGEAYTIDFTKSIDFNGFKDLTAAIPQSVAYPVTLERIYAASLSEKEARSGSVYIDNIRGLYIDASNGVNVPKSSEYTDPSKLQAKDLDCLGVSLELTKDKPTGYFTEYKNNVLKVNLDTQNGGIINTNASQWKQIESALQVDKTNNIIIRTDVNPQHFKTYKEYELFRNLLKKYIEKGKDILVVSNESGSDYTATADGITYINIGKRGEAETNKGGSILKINANEGLKYAFDVQR